MQCTACGATLNPTGLFPGSSLVCACGAKNTVSLPGEHPFRTAGHAPTPAPAASTHEAPMPRLHCPRCESPLDDTVTDGNPMLWCARCTGAFVDHPTLKSMIDAELDAAPDAPAPIRLAPAPKLERDVRYLRCPRCNETMSRLNFGHRSGIMLDACRPHGTWFDKDELSAVLSFVRKGGLARGERQAEGPVPVGEAARMVGAIHSLLEEERMEQERKVADVTDLVDDLLSVLSPGDRHWAWAARRRR